MVSRTDRNTERPETAVSDDRSGRSTDDPQGNAVKDSTTQAVGRAAAVREQNRRKKKPSKKRNKHQRLTSSINKSSDAADAER